MAKQEYTYAIPINEAVDGGTATVLAVKIEGKSERGRGKILQRILQKNYNLNRSQAIKCLRAMEFNTIKI